MATVLYEQSFHSGYRLGIEYTQSSATSEAAISSNSTTLTVSIYLRSTGSSWTINSSAKKTVKLTVDGTTYTYTASGLAALSGNQKKILLTKTVTIKHNADGTRSVACSGSFAIEVTLSGEYVGTVSVPSRTITMARIPRPSTPVITGTTDVGNEIVIALNRASSEFTHTLQYSTDGSTFTDIATSVGDSLAWTIPEAVALAFPNATSGSVTIRAITFLNGSSMGARDTKIVANITESYAKPSITSVQVTQQNDANIPLFIAGKSTATISIAASLLHGATASYYTVTIGGQSVRINSTTGSAEYTFTIAEGSSGNLSCTVIVTDSRGYVSTSYPITISVVAYSPPAISEIEIVRGRMVDGEFVESNVGTYVRITFSGTISSVGDYNKKAFEAAYKLASGNYSELVQETNLSTYTPSSFAVIPATQLDSDKTYKVKVRLIDSFGDASEIITVRSQGVLMNFGADGRSAAVGGKATVPGKFQVFYNAVLESGVTMVPIDSGTDLNDLKTPGWYYIENASGVLHCGISSGMAALEILMLSDTEVTQILRYPNADDIIADMSRYYDGNAWKAWASQMSSSAIMNLIGNDLKTLVRETFFPVGRYWVSEDSTDPATIIGGTWVSVTDQFLVGAGNDYVAGSTGGNASQSINVSHKHISPNGYSSSAQGGIAINGTVAGGNGKAYRTSSTGYSGTLTSNVTLYYTGDASVSATIDTIPPYRAVYIWRRTA